MLNYLKFWFSFVSSAFLLLLLPPFCFELFFFSYNFSACHSIVQFTVRCDGSSKVIVNATIDIFFVSTSHHNLATCSHRMRKNKRICFIYNVCRA